MKKFAAFIASFIGVLALICATSPSSKEIEVLHPDPLTESIWMKEMGIKQERFHLSNGVYAWIVEAPKIPRSVMAVSIGSGTMQDPPKTLGCAHLLEHMLFMGSQKHPQEDEFSHFINHASGVNNAMTSPSNTTFGLTCRNEDALEAFERLSDMIQHPLLRQECIDREKQAVNEEFRQKIALESYKTWLINFDLIEPSHPLHKLGCGNAQTLENVCAEDLISWHTKHYVPSNTTVILLTSHDLEEQKKWLLDHWHQWGHQEASINEPIENVSFTLHGHEFAQAVSDQGKNNLSIFWYIPLSKSEDTNSLGHIGSWLGHEYPGGLCQYLKNEGFAFNVFARSESMPPIGMVAINIELTPKGLAEIDKCLASLESYLQFLTQNTIDPSWMTDCQNRVKTAWQSATLEASLEQGLGLAQSLQLENLKTYPYKLQWPTPESIQTSQKMLEQIRIGTGLKVLFVADPKLTPPSTLVASKMEPWSQTRYEIRSFLDKDDFVPSARWAYGLKNPFLPQELPAFSHQSLDKVASVTSCEFGDFIHYSNAFCGGLRDSLYVSLKCQESASTNNEANSITPKKIDPEAFWILFTKCMDEQNLVLYEQASEAGQNLALSSESGGLSLLINGYSTLSGPKVLQEFFESLLKVETSADRFEQHKAELIEDLAALDRCGPSERIRYILRTHFLDNTLSTTELTERLSAISYSDFLRMHEQFLKSPVTMRAMATSSQKELWIETLNQISHLFVKNQKQTSEAFPSPLFVTKWKSKPKKVIKDYHSREEGNLSLFVWPLNESDHFKEQLSVEMLQPSLSTEAFTHLRSEKQLGYVVQAGQALVSQRPVLFLLVLSSNKSPEEVTQAMKEEVNLWKNHVSSLSKEEFEKNKERLKKEYQEPIETSIDDLKRSLSLWSKNEDPYTLWQTKVEQLQSLSLEESRLCLQELLSQEPYYVYCLPQAQANK